ncbi:hypothetical protein PC118_g13444 [Phytophthora cactorum]|uniref:Uncharacterized protein n=1 Tax=Phytophthora cactorum TaxID=29920 RepID=A0A8T1FIH5_9STRA|nr:hypothetical protein PC118_g13444 [Phytophthora cactorum]KAG3007960.1 hypothetical protein PC119_g14384 [Phytophthora cactorum]
MVRDIVQFRVDNRQVSMSSCTAQPTVKHFRRAQLEIAVVAAQCMTKMQLSERQVAQISVHTGFKLSISFFQCNLQRFLLV